MRREDSNSILSTEQVVKKISFDSSSDSSPSKLKSRVPFNKVKQIRQTTTKKEPDFQGGLFQVNVVGFTPSNYYRISDKFKKIGSYTNIDYEDDSNWFIIYYNKEEDSQEALKLSMCQLIEGEMIGVYSKTHERSFPTHSSMNISFNKQANRPRRVKSALTLLLEYVCIWW